MVHVIFEIIPEELLGGGRGGRMLGGVLAPVCLSGLTVHAQPTAQLWSL
jgi:hypothetical protein